jgi:hypothetical protein
MIDSTQGGALLVSALGDHGVGSAARTVVSLLEGEPHRIPVARVDLASLAAAGPLPALGKLVGGTTETRILANLGWSSIEGELRGPPPRVILATDPLAATVADHWRSRGLLRAPVVGMVNGLWLDPAWASTAVDRLAVADLAQGEQALALGLPAEAVVPCGVPVCGGFAIPTDDRTSYRAHFGLPRERPVVLTVCHGLELDALSSALFQLGLIGERATLLFDVARHDAAADHLRRRAALYGVQAQMFGKVEDAGSLWAASSIVVARPHLYVEQRALAQRTPVCFVALEREAERETAREWVARGIGRSAPSLATLGAELELLLEERALTAAEQRLGGISGRNAASEIARLVAQVRASADHVLAEVRERKPAPEASTPTAGPLEAIGVEAAPRASSSLAELEAEEAEASALVREHQTEADRWQARVTLAAERGEQELSAEAARRAERHRAAMHRALAELARIAERRKSLRVELAQEPRAADPRVERSFRELEVDAALAALKRKLQDG